MDIDFTWLLWSLPLAFAFGWIASRLDLRQWRMESRQTPKAYFRGLNHLLNEQQDQAIDAFIEAVQGDPDTAELHFALGNLFRRRGDYDRAVRVHEHLLARADINRKDRDRAQHALAMDFLKAGLLDRSEAALHKLDGSSFEGEALLALLSIYERSRDWPNAQKVAQKLEAAQQGSFTPRLAHYLCEEADLARIKGETAKALSLLADAVKSAPQMARPWLATASLKVQIGDLNGAYKAMQQLAEKAPQGLPLAVFSMGELAKQLHKEKETIALLHAVNERAPSLDLTEALVKLSPDANSARSLYLYHLQREPSLVIATQWLKGETLSDPVAKNSVIKALEQAGDPLKRYRCAACGFEARQHFWQCPGCQSWDSYPARRVEEL